jgi:hypothetical protein
MSLDNKPNHCPYCGRFTGIDPDGFYDSCERGADPDTAYVAAFCDQSHADKFHGRAITPNYWKPESKKTEASIGA